MVPGSRMDAERPGAQKVRRGRGGVNRPLWLTRAGGRSITTSMTVDPSRLRIVLYPDPVLLKPTAAVELPA